ncbi:MAG TPA: hypothetical protein VM425_01035 [Myxococcota bacterium]|nr:hypothetical protein [Myxococcota bacterium]
MTACCLWTSASAAAGGLDADTVVRLARDKFLFELNADGAEAHVKMLGALEDGRVPAIVYSLQRDKRVKKPYEIEIDKLREKIAGLEAQMKRADDSLVFAVGRKLEEAKYELDSKLMQAAKKGLAIHQPNYQSLRLGLVVMQRTKSAWTIGQSLELGNLDAAALGARPEGIEFETKSGDSNNNGESELAIDAFVELFEKEPETGDPRTHNYHYLVEFFPGKATVTFRLDGGIDSGGRCSSPMDAGLTGRYFIRRRSDPAELVAIRSSKQCEQDEGLSKAKGEKPGVKSYNWSEENSRWHLFEGFEADSYLIVAATSEDRQELEGPAKMLGKRRQRKRLKLGPGFPQILKSDNITGLKAGRFVLALGLCKEKKQALAATRFLGRRLRGRIYKLRMRGIARKDGPNLEPACPGAR